MTPVGFEIDRRCLFFLYNSFLLTLLIQRSMFLSADIIQISIVLQQTTSPVWQGSFAIVRKRN